MRDPCLTVVVLDTTAGLARIRSTNLGTFRRSIGGDDRHQGNRFRDRVRGVSKMHPGIITEALGLVTRWGIRDRFRKLKR